jgi:hypothetical protein
LKRNLRFLVTRQSQIATTQGRVTGRTGQGRRPQGKDHRPQGPSGKARWAPAAGERPSAARGKPRRAPAAGVRWQGPPGAGRKGQDLSARPPTTPRRRTTHQRCPYSLGLRRSDVARVGVARKCVRRRERVGRPEAEAGPRSRELLGRTAEGFAGPCKKIQEV